MSKGKLESVQGVHARFIHTRILTGRANVHSAKQIGQRRGDQGRRRSVL